MSERFNGKAPFLRRTHGSERRGVYPVPDIRYPTYLEQSRADKEKVLRRILERRNQELGLGNRELPAFKHKHELVENIESHKAVIVGGATGSGKSTQLPQYLYEAGYDLTVMLVPRRVIADGLGERIREELSEQIDSFNGDETVGIIHGERTERHENNKIVVMTPNTYIRMARNLQEQYGDKKVAIVADEIHEANLFTELAVGVAAKSVEAQDDWHLVAASATHNAATLEAPFQKINNGYVPKIEIEGRPFNVELREEPKLNPMQVYAKHGDGHDKSMIFTSGKKEIDFIIEETQKELEKVEKGSSNKVVFRKLHGDLTERELQRINDPVPEGFRLCIVSSPAGMSGITIPGVTLVASDGTINRSELDDEGADGLSRRYLSKAGIIQEIGRAGRDVPGGIGYLAAPVVIKRAGKSKEEGDEAAHFPFKPFDEREEHEPPEIWHTNLSRAALSMAAVGYRLYDINDYIPHPVQQLDIVNAEEALLRLGALDEEFAITGIGAKMDEFPVIPELSRGLYEAFRPGRSIESMARAAFIAAAIGSGGLQDHMASTEQKKATRRLVRDTTHDDFIGQLDIMTTLHERARTKLLYDNEMREMGLNPKRIERAMKVARKALAVEKIRLQNVVLSAPTPDEEQQLRNDFTAGFIDFTYQNVGRDPRMKSQLLYRNIHGNSESTRRKISDRSLAVVGEGVHVAGIPRWYEKGHHKDNTPIRHNILDFVMPVDPKVVAEYALANGIVERRSINVRVVGGRVVSDRQGYFGSITVTGAPQEVATDRMLSQKEQEVLYEYVQNHPGQALRAYRDLANNLSQLHEITPPDLLATVRRPDAPAEVTNETISALIKELVKTTPIAHEIDERIRQKMYSQGASLSRYFAPDMVRALRERSPKVLEIAGVLTELSYSQGTPYVTKLTRAQKRAIQSSVHLPDGREVYMSIPGHNGNTKVLASLATLAN